MANTQYEELIQGLSKEELAAFDYLCNALEYTSSTAGKGSYIVNILDTACSTMDDLVTSSKIVFDNNTKQIIVETVC